MEFRKTIKKDIESIMRIVNQAKEYFKKNKINQWQDGYPNTKVIEEDIKNKCSYVLLNDNTVVGTSVIDFGGEATYNNIYNGKWLSDSKYAVIHRIAIDNNYKGLGIAAEIIRNAEKLCVENDIKSIRVDTHKDNISMQRLLKKNGFTYCGIIYLEDKSERIAFEKISYTK